jgi:hypothetical protein
MAINRVGPVHLRTFVAQLVHAGYAPSTVKATYQIVSQIFAQAVLDGLLSRTPCVGIQLAQGTPPRPPRHTAACAPVSSAR